MFERFKKGSGENPLRSMKKYGTIYYIVAILIAMGVMMFIKVHSDTAIHENENRIYSNANNINANASNIEAQNKAIEENRTMLIEISNSLSTLHQPTTPVKHYTYKLNIVIEKKTNMGLGFNDLQLMMISIPTDKQTYDNIKEGEPIPYEAYDKMGLSGDWTVKVLTKEMLETN